MTFRNSLAVAGLLLVMFVALAGLAAFSPQQAAPAAPSTPQIFPEQPTLPTTVSGRVAAAVFAAALTSAPDPAPVFAAARDAADEDRLWEGVRSLALIAPAPTAPAGTPPETTTTTTPPQTTTTTTTPPQTTTTTTTPPQTTTTTTPEATSTTVADEAEAQDAEPVPSEGGEGAVEAWRGLVASYFPADMVDQALRVVDCESNGDPNAVNSRSGAAGLFQFIPSTWAFASEAAGFGGAGPLEPEANVASAAWLVARSIEDGNDAWHHWVCRP